MSMNIMSEEPESRKISLHPDDPDGVARLILQALNGYVEEGEGGDPFLRQTAEAVEIVKPYAAGWLAARELIEQGEYTDEEMAELAEQHVE